ncbi:MAG: diguanylate cyclase [Lachnospiraceae bacterium]|nr:diguanylate cyclase [Lachnospiraceae bacterium]
MGKSEQGQKKGSEYEALQSTKATEESLKTINIMMPIIIILLIVIVLGIYTYIQKKNIIRDAEQVTNQMAEYVAENLSDDMDYAQSSIKFVSDAISQSMTSPTLENPSEVIAPMVENTPFGGIEYIRADGMNVMNIGEPFDASDRVYYIEGIHGNTGIWNNYHPKTSQETLINFYTPVMYEDEIVGVVTGYIAATSQIAPLFENELYGEPIYGFLMDENDMIICSTLTTQYIYDLSLEEYVSQFGATDSQIDELSKTIHKATEEAACYDDPTGGGRVCVATVPGTEWRVVISIPEDSFHGILNKNTKNAVITIFIITAILSTYAGIMLAKSVKRRREIAKENEKLEEENRVYNEENQRAFKEISAIRDIIASANMGVWRIELVDGKEPRMYANETMKELLGASGIERTPEEFYNDWFENITPKAVASVLESVDKMKRGYFDENTYLWVHPTKGERFVRCGGTAEKITGGYLLGGYHYDVDDAVRGDLEKVRMLQDALEEKNDYNKTLEMLAGVYNSMHVMDLEEDTIIEFSAEEKFKDIVNHDKGAAEKVTQAISSLMTDEYRERALEFTDLTTVAERMKNKRFITAQFVSNRIGWFLATFITLEKDLDGKPTKVILTTQSIDEKKKEEEQLIYKSRTDELTGLYNRRAYEEDIYEQNDFPAKDYFVSMSLDVNGLKVVNDTLGHGAGDELLIGASQCMKRCFGPYGNLYRTGGDEFIAILFCDSKKLKDVLQDFDETVASWSGKLVDKLTIAYGFVTKEEKPTLSVRELAAIADKRMYGAKSAYYRAKGVDRRGHQDAHKALCELYTKIMKINISEDSYQIVNMDDMEKTQDKGFSESISSWLSDFAKKGQVHPEDMEEYLKKTNLSYMKEFFNSGKTDLHIIYRRKEKDSYKRVMMEVIPASDYSSSNQSLYLYVKDIDR